MNPMIVFGYIKEQNDFDMMGRLLKQKYIDDARDYNKVDRLEYLIGNAISDAEDNGRFPWYISAAIDFSNIDDNLIDTKEIAANFHYDYFDPDTGERMNYYDYRRASEQFKGADIPDEWFTCEELSLIRDYQDKQTPEHARVLLEESEDGELSVKDFRYFLHHENLFPEMCYSTTGLSDECQCVIAIENGVGGYFTTAFIERGEKAVRLADKLNAQLGISRAEAEAMKVYSLGKWTDLQKVQEEHHRRLNETKIYAIVEYLVAFEYPDINDAYQRFLKRKCTPEPDPAQVEYDEKRREFEYDIERYDPDVDFGSDESVSNALLCMSDTCNLRIDQVYEILVIDMELISVDEWPKYSEYTPESKVQANKEKFAPAEYAMTNPRTALGVPDRSDDRER